MKCVAAVVFLSLQLAGSAFAALQTSHADTENAVQQRKRDLKEQSPLNKEEKEMLKRMLADNTLRRTSEVSHVSPEQSSDPLSDAMRKSARRKHRSLKKNRKLQNYYNYGYGPDLQDEQYAAHAPAAEIPEKVSMVLEAFQDSSDITQDLLAPDASYLTPGTEYMYSNEPLLNVVFDVPPGASRGAYLVNERDRIAVVSGTCTRTDPKINYVGRAYCQFEYRFLDRTNNIEATITAEGPITMGDINTLSVTGGTGIFRRTVGTVVLETGNLRAGSPPMFIPSRRLDLPSSYLVNMFVFMDSVDLELE
jgi:hypothetical protein